MYDVVKEQLWFLPPLRITAVGPRFYSMDNRRLAIAKILCDFDHLDLVPCRDAGDCAHDMNG